MIDLLKEINLEVVQKQQYAETKNGIIVAFCSACLFGAFNLLMTDTTNTSMYYPQWFYLYLYSFMFFNFITAIISLHSFMPKTNVLEDCDEDEELEGILIYFGEIAKFKNARSFVVNLYKRYKNECDKKGLDITKVELDYARQIIYNANIVERKFMCSKYALYMLLTAFIPFFLILIWKELYTLAICTLIKQAEIFREHKKNNKVEL